MLGHQIYLDGDIVNTLTSNQTTSISDVFRNSLAIPVYFSAASVLIFAIHILHTWRPIMKICGRLLLRHKAVGQEAHSQDGTAVDTTPQPSLQVQSHILSHGGLAIFAFEVARLLGCLLLMALSLATVLVGVDATKSNLIESRGKDVLIEFTKAKSVQSASCITALYASLLAIISVSAQAHWNRIASRHLVVVLLSLFGVYIYRDIWPLAKYTDQPLDAAEGWLLWTKIAVLVIIAVIVPLFMPRQYIPIDPKKPTIAPNPEQTASIFSMLLYQFLDPVVFMAYRTPKLSREDLPQIADYDQAKNLVKRSFPRLDPFSGGKEHHIFWGLLGVFRNEYIILALMLVFETCASLASPVGVNQLLRFLETNGENATIKPWLWIIWLFAAPMLRSMALEWYIYIATRVEIQVEAIITQLVFEHALRIRIKAEISEEDSSLESTATNTLPTEDIASSEPVGTENPVGSPSSNGDSRSSNEPSTNNSTGKINNLITTDLQNIRSARDFLLPVLYVPLQIILSTWFLYSILGWSAFVGLVVMVVLLILPGYITMMVQSIQAEQMKHADSRVQTVTETLNVLRMIKLFGWESKTKHKISGKRDEELKWTRKREILDIIVKNLNFLIPMITMLATFGTYTVIMKADLTASTVFASMTVFDLLRELIRVTLARGPQIVRGKVSLDRVSDFLVKTELLDSFSEKSTGERSESTEESSQMAPSEIGFQHAAFSWSSGTSGTQTPSTRHFSLHIEGKLIFKRGSINIVVGPTGSGKTSLLMALLGEMHFMPSSPSSSFNFPREGGVAYAAQESWVQNETIKENILFGAAFDKLRYDKVIYQCGLDRDLELLDAGDDTEVGEKGLTLSGGQKARITLARAIYSSAEVLLLDDVLGALDVHTAKHVVEKCLSGDLVKGRSVILVTHNVALVSPIAHLVVSMGKDGRILSQGSLSDALAQNSSIGIEVLGANDHLSATDEETELADVSKADAVKGDGKLVTEEETQEGHVSWGAHKMYFSALGGNHPLGFWTLFLGGLILINCIVTAQTWWLGFWASQYVDSNSRVNVSFYMAVYALLIGAVIVIYAIVFVDFLFGSLRASKSLHKILIEAVLGTTWRWLDKTPVSRVIARGTQDIAAVDGLIPFLFSFLLETSASMAVKFTTLIIFTPIWIIPSAIVASIGAWVGQIFIKAQLPIKREMSKARSPVLAHFGTAMAGIVSIRAYGAQRTFREESYIRIDRYTSAARLCENLNRWISVRLDIFSSLFSVGLASYLVYNGGGSGQASKTGFSLNMAVGFSSMILWWVQLFNEFEISANSLERIHEYANIEQEPKSTANGEPPAHWPSSGDLNVVNLSARYSPRGPVILRNLSFHIKSGERIGIVGRTGSGKSSLTLALLRCILTEGSVYYDGLLTEPINLDVLRSKITIIPQTPELMASTLRQNLDPFEQYDDATLNGALRAAGLFSLQNDTDEARITLDSLISAAGSNLSVGQRQILALARAIVRGSKLLVLDEATSSIDYETDSVIQASLRKELGADVTLITVAHRLQTIMDSDRIMVLDAGEIVEFDRPSNLLKNRESKFRALVDESRDKEKLLAMVEENQ